MASDVDIRRVVAWCVATMVRYHDARSPHCAAKMVDEIRACASWVSDRGVGGLEAAERILDPVGEVLRARYGTEAGAGLYAEFVEAFERTEAFAGAAQG